MGFPYLVMALESCCTISQLSLCAHLKRLCTLNKALSCSHFFTGKCALNSCKIVLALGTDLIVIVETNATVAPHRKLKSSHARCRQTKTFLCHEPSE